MKCERCNNEIKKGELFCSKCGAKKEVESTSKIDISALKNENSKEDDMFYQKDLEKKSSSVNGFLIFIIILLIAGIVYLVYFDNTIIKRDKKVDEIDTTRKINYEQISLTLDSEMDVFYEDNRILFQKEGVTASFYEVDEKYQDIVKDARELLLKWEEQGLRIDSHKEDGAIYEFLGTYQYNNVAIFITAFQDSTFVMGVNFSTVDAYNGEKDSFKEILKTIKPVSKDSNLYSNYPELGLEFNLNPLGSQ